jgi:ABC-type transporter Mla subunit MlaD
MNQRPSITRTVFGISLMIFASALVGAAQDEGVKQIQQLIKKANSVVESITDAKLQLQKTMDAYNAVLAPDVKDRRDAYKKLQKEMATADKKRAAVSTRSGEMNTEADKLFKSWEASTAAIGDPDLRQRSEQRLTTAKQRFDGIRKAGQSGSEAYTRFMKSLQDQVTFLGHDLNPGAVAALKPDADKLNAQAQELYAAIDKTTAAANDNISRLSAD